MANTCAAGQFFLIVASKQESVGEQNVEGDEQQACREVHRHWSLVAPMDCLLLPSTRRALPLIALR